MKNWRPQIPRDPKFIEFVKHKCKCCVTGYYCEFDSMVEVHHYGKRGLGQKCSDYEVVPLLWYLHRKAQEMTREAFEKEFNVNFAEISKALVEEYKKQGGEIK